MVLETFHPAVAAWFKNRLGAPTEIQRQAWPAVASSDHTLIAAPTGSGKTLAAFLAAINALVETGLEGHLQDRTYVLYVSPLKALSNDIEKNLQQPLMGIRDQLLEHGLADVNIRTAVRTGDTPAGERSAMRRTPPHILVTTPESLYILLTSESGRQMLNQVETVIVDEIHALAGNKRGAHLSLSLERLAALTARPLTRVGLSATQKPIETMARLLVGDRNESCRILDLGEPRQRDLALELPNSPLEPVMANEVWSEIYDRLAALTGEHRTTLIFVNTRRAAERTARHLGERIGEDAVTTHHGSLSREHRLQAEQRLKSGQLRALVATASLELGIDIGSIDLVCQLGSPRGIAPLLQRVGRSGHSVGGIPKGRLFPLTRDDLVECVALLDAARQNELDAIAVPEHPLDVLAQQIVAEVASREWSETELYRQFRQAWPYRNLSWDGYLAVIRMLADGFSTRRGRRSAYLHRDAVHGTLRPRRSARLTAVMNGGAIPDQFDYDVVLSPEGHTIGNLNEDFAFESLAGDIFQLGNTSYRILKVEPGRVIVEDAKGQPPNIPFWFGEAPGRTDELSAAVSRLRARVEGNLESGAEQTLRALMTDYQLTRAASDQLIRYLGAAKAALGTLPTQETIVFERFFDEVGDMHLVIHSPYGSRINRAWGLALRKRFCRKFNFELQAAALEDSIVLSLGPTHSFPLEEVGRYLHPHSVRNLLIQALLDAPMFPTHWRWNASIALAVRRNRNGRRAPAQFQRSDAEDLMAVVFPDQLACLENIAGDREIPDHPLVEQTLTDCLHDTMDIVGLQRVLEGLVSGRILLHVRDLPAPSPLADEVLNARPYAFLDDGAAEERRTLAVRQRSSAEVIEPDSGTLDSQAIAEITTEAWPMIRDADELHDALNIVGFLRPAETAMTGGMAPQAAWPAYFETLMEQGRATCALRAGEAYWVAAERLTEWLTAFPETPIRPEITPTAPFGAPEDAEAALRALVRSRLELSGPIRSEALAADFGLSAGSMKPVLLALEQEGYAIRCTVPEDPKAEAWCERGLIARIQRRTIHRRRQAFTAVSPQRFMRFLLDWHRPDGADREGPEALLAVVRQLEGFSAAAIAWEMDILPLRMSGYQKDWLDTLSTTGRVMWSRLAPPAKGSTARAVSSTRKTPIALTVRAHTERWRGGLDRPDASELPLSSAAQRVLNLIHERGASFFADLLTDSGLLRSQVEDAMAELVSWGLVNADGFSGLRALIQPPSTRNRGRGRRSRHRLSGSIEAAGRWTALAVKPRARGDDDVAHIAWTLLIRYGVVFRALLERETAIPTWRDLIYVYRRLEARGEIHGGRFVSGFAGEQFALPSAAARLKREQSRSDTGEWVAVSGSDPLNLVGIICPGPRVPALAGNRVLYRDGIPVAVRLEKRIEWLVKIEPDAAWRLERLLNGFAAPGTIPDIRHDPVRAQAGRGPL